MVHGINRTSASLGLITAAITRNRELQCVRRSLRWAAALGRACGHGSFSSLVPGTERTFGLEKGIQVAVVSVSIRKSR